ncbi:MAG: hypothetical protein WCL16_11825 [bacterium]
MKTTRKHLRSFLTLVWLATLGVACAPHTTPAKSRADADQPRTETISSDGVTVTLRADTGLAHLDRDMILRICVSAPTNFDITLPPLENRFSGFTMNGSYDSEPQLRAGRREVERIVKLTPLAATEHRVAPLIVAWLRTDRLRASDWLTTRPIVFEEAPLVNGALPASVSAPDRATWIPPSPRNVLLSVLALLMAAALGYGAYRLLRRWRREIVLRRLSPKERALRELQELLARDLVGHQRVKDFYFELTGIVRAYIERAHAIRAPEQTTEEFLDAVSHDVRFTPVVVARLRAFLQAADLVKYAAFTPERDGVDQSLNTARSYIETDAEARAVTSTGIPLRTGGGG